jgi:uncharacterized protein (DUF924 family)
MDPSTVIDFWFQELGPKDWFRKDDAADARIAQQFRTVHGAAARGELWDWRSSAPGALAEIIVLDQFSRNIFRNHPRAFATDGMALVLAQEAVRHCLDRELSPAQRSFMYMPFMHSESVRIHETAVELFSQPGLEENLDFELRPQGDYRPVWALSSSQSDFGPSLHPGRSAFLKNSPGF